MKLNIPINSNPFNSIMPMTTRIHRQTVIWLSRAMALALALIICPFHASASPKAISAILLARRLNNKDTKAVAFDISEDKIEWTEAGAMDFPDSPTPVMRILVLPGKATGRYFRLKVTGSNNAPHASLSEVILYQRL